VQEGGDKDDLVAKQLGWRGGVGGPRRVGGGRGGGMSKATGGAGLIYNEWARGGAAGDGAAAGRTLQLSGPDGAVAREERAARAKKLRAKLTTT
jgi:hypothetical protein